MKKGLGMVAMLAVAAGFLAIGTSLAATRTTPRWVTHVRNYPGGISGGVRAVLDPGVASATPGLSPTQGAMLSSRPAATPTLRT